MLEAEARLKKIYNNLPGLWQSLQPRSQRHLCRPGPVRGFEPRPSTRHRSSTFPDASWPAQTCQGTDFRVRTKPRKFFFLIFVFSTRRRNWSSFAKISAENNEIASPRVSGTKHGNFGNFFGAQLVINGLFFVKVHFLKYEWKSLWSTWVAHLPLQWHNVVILNSGLLK